MDDEVGQFIEAYHLYGDPKRAYDTLDNPTRSMVALMGDPRTLASIDVGTSAMDRQELLEWLTAVIKGDVCETTRTKEGIETVPPKVSDRVQAASLLAKISGFFDESEKSDGGQHIHLHSYDNGRLQK